MSIEEASYRLAAAREGAEAARGRTDDLRYADAADVELGTISECLPFLEAALVGFSDAKTAYAEGDTETGELHYAFGATWSAIATLCFAAAHTPPT
jgi:hypothetical protein